MVMRTVIIFLLALSLTSCVQKGRLGENEPIQSMETKEEVPAIQKPEPQNAVDENISGQPAGGELSSAEKPTIQEIQQALKNAKLYEGTVDGVIGPKTKKAIENFQSQNNLNADGKVGPKTWQQLKPFLNK